MPLRSHAARTCATSDQQQRQSSSSKNVTVSFGSLSSSLAIVCVGVHGALLTVRSSV